MISAAALLAGCGSEPDGAAGSSVQSLTGGPAHLRAIVQVTVNHDPRGQSAYAILCEGDVSQLQGAAPIDPDRACAALRDSAVRERLANGPAAGRACDPVAGGDANASGTGTVNGESFSFSLDRKDSCDVADWDGLLSDVLVPPQL